MACGRTGLAGSLSNPSDVRRHLLGASGRLLGVAGNFLRRSTLFLDGRGDPRLLRQILINLLSNAVKFTPAGGTVTVSARSGPDGSPLITVADTGIGIAAENISEVLKPFVRVESAFNADVEGTGLGLPLVKSYVELHGGSLEIESQPDVGTTVRLHFAAEGGGEDDSAGKAQRQTG